MQSEPTVFVWKWMTHIIPSFLLTFSAFFVLGQIYISSLFAFPFHKHSTLTILVYFTDGTFPYNGLLLSPILKLRSSPQASFMNLHFLSLHFSPIKIPSQCQTFLLQLFPWLGWIFHFNFPCLPRVLDGDGFL